jgi:hypothetical protein
MNEAPSLYEVTVKGMGGAVKMTVQGTSERDIIRQFASFGVRVCFNNISSFVTPDENEGCSPQLPSQPSLFEQKE